MTNSTSCFADPFGVVTQHLGCWWVTDVVERQQRFIAIGSAPERDPCDEWIGVTVTIHKTEAVVGSKGEQFGALYCEKMQQQFNHSTVCDMRPFGLPIVRFVKLKKSLCLLAGNAMNNHMSVDSIKTHDVVVRS